VNVNAICEVNSALFNLIASRSAALHSDVLAGIADRLKPEGVELSDFAVTSGGKRLVCFFGDHLAVLRTVAQLNTDFPGNTFNTLAMFEYSGEQYKESGTPLYPIDQTAGLPTIFKYAKDVDGTAYSTLWAALSTRAKKSADPFWRTSDFNPRDYT